MKKSLFGLLTICLFVGCNNHGSKTNVKQSEKEALEMAVVNAQKSIESEKEIFLGFRFGMSESEVDSLFNVLLKSNKIYANSESSYQYDFNTENYNFYLNFVPKYYEGKLYEMVYPLTNTLIPSSKDYVFAALAFIRSERGKSFAKFTTKDALGDEVYTNIKGNLIVSFYSGRKAIMKYTNAPIAKIVDDIEEQKKQEKAKETYSDF